MAANSATSLVDLDFDKIKSNLKTHMKSQSIIRDYDFEGSNINVLLDVLSYNTSLNNYYINMLSNEMFLDTAQERDSILAHIKELNYVPRSVHSAVAYVNIEIQPDDAPSSISIPKWTIFNSTVDGKSLKFSTQEDLIIKPTVNTTSNTTTYAVSNVAIYEGAIVEEFAIADNSNNFTVDISNKNIDTRHLVVSVKDSTTAANSTYSDWEKKETLFGINATSNVYFTEPQIGDKFKLTFGDGIFGKKPIQGNVLKLKYRNASGTGGNNAKKFTNQSNIQGYSKIIINTVTNSSGGQAAETVEEIRFNAPKAFQVQERAVTKDDYKIIVQRQFPEVKNVLAFGGENLVPPRFGKVIIAVDLADADGVPESKKNAIQDYLAKKSPLGIDPVVVIPEFSFLESTVDVSYDVSVTDQTIEAIKSKAQTALLAYAETNINTFDSVFRNSKAAAAIDAADVSIISSQLTNRVFKKLTPSNIRTTFKLEYNNELIKDDIFVENDTKTYYKPAFESTLFNYDRNGVTENNVFFMDNGTGNVMIVRSNSQNQLQIISPNAGTIDYTTGIININAITIYSYTGTALKVYARCTNRDIKTKNASILQMNAEDLTFNITQERL